MSPETTRQVGALIDRIQSRFHEGHRQALPELLAMAANVEACGIGDGLVEALHAIGDALEQHMFKEEMRLFPMMEQGGNTLIGLLIEDLHREHVVHENAMNDLLELLDQLGWRRFGIVAHDVGSFIAQALARRAPERITGLFFFDCAYPGIGARWVEPRHLGEVWYQHFHQQPWAAELVGSSREACRIYLRHFLSHWSHQQGWIEPELERWVDQFMKPGRLQGGFNWYASVNDARLAVIEGRAPPAGPVALPTRVLWGAHDPVLKVQWADRLHEHFSALRFDVQPDSGHFVHVECPDAAAGSIDYFFRHDGSD
jgi:pimeloyl-ACP methyl ester carboxylesterase